MTWKTNEDFSVLNLGRKSLLNHLPNVFRSTIRTAVEQAFAEFSCPHQSSHPEPKTYVDVTIPTESTTSKPVLQKAGTHALGIESVEIELEGVDGAPL